MTFRNSLIGALALGAMAVAVPAVDGAPQIVVNAPNASASAVVTGTNAPAGAQLELFVNGASSGATTALGDGSFAFSGANIAKDDDVTVQVQESWYFDSGDDGFAANAGGSITTGGGTLTLTVNDAVAAPQMIKVSSGNPTASMRVLEFRVRNPGTTSLFYVQLNDAEGNTPFVPVGITPGVNDFVTYQVPLVTTDATRGLNPSGFQNFWLYFYFNQDTTNGDVLEFDYVRVREYFDWHFDNDGDLMGNALSNATATVVGGNLELTNTIAGTNASLIGQFLYIPAGIHTVFETSIDANPTIQPNLVDFAYAIDTQGYAGSGWSEGWAPNPGSFVTVERDLTTAPAFGSNWQDLATLNVGTWFSPMYPDTLGETAVIDYIRLRPATYYGPSSTTALGAKPVVTVDPAAANFVEGGGAVVVDATATVSDADSTTLTAVAVAINNAVDGADEALAATASGAIQQSDITYDVGGSFLNILPAGGAPVADFEAVLQSLTYVNNAEPPTTDTRVLSIIATDDEGNNSDLVTKSITIELAPNAPPVIADLNPSVTTPNDATSYTFQEADFGVSDPDSPASAVVFTVVALPSNGSLDLGPARAPLGLNGTFTLQDVIDGQLDYLFTGTAPDTDSFDFTVEDEEGIPSAVATMSITIPSVANVRDWEVLN